MATVITKSEADLALYIKQIEDLNKELNILEEKKREIVRVGTRLEGVVAYLRKTVEEEKASTQIQGATVTENPK
jgi:hypothetical protein